MNTDLQNGDIIVFCVVVVDFMDVTSYHIVNLAFLRPICSSRSHMHNISAVNIKILYIILCLKLKKHNI